MNNENNPNQENEDSFSSEDLKKKLKWYESKYGPYYESKGLKNWKNLFRKPTLMECTIFVMIMLSFFGAYLYVRDLDVCYSGYESLPEDMCEACNLLTNYQQMGEEDMPDFSNLSFVNKTEKV